MSEEKKSESKKMIWAGRVVSALPAAMLLMSATMKFLKPAEFVEGIQHLGWNSTTMTYVGIVEVICVVVYAIPRTSVLGAILITGYLGGAIATHVRVGDQFISPLILGIVVWLGIWLREKRLRDLLPIKT